MSFVKPLSLILFYFCLPALVGAEPPLPEARIVTDDYYGTKVDDPYRYFEEKGQPDVDAWSRAFAAFSNEALAALTYPREGGYHHQ